MYFDKKLLEFNEKLNKIFFNQFTARNRVIRIFYYFLIKWLRDPADGDDF